jgi:hypothetical protein
VALIDQQGNQTIVERLERQSAREQFFLGILDDTTLNRRQRRALRKATFQRNPSKRQIKKEYQGREETLRRLVAFFGPDRLFGRDELAYVRFGKGTRSAWPVQPLNKDEAHRLKKTLRKARR